MFWVTLYFSFYFNIFLLCFIANVESIAALQLNWKDIKENKTNSCIRENGGYFEHQNLNVLSDYIRAKYVVQSNF